MLTIASPSKILKYLYRLYITKDPVVINHHKWIKNKGERLRFAYNLSNDSVVFDVGGYRGDWSSEIFQRYNCNIFVFEPVFSFYKIIEKRFADIQKIKVFNFGLSNSTRKTRISLHEDGSSSVRDWGISSETITLIDITEFIKKNEIQKIDLIKINTEGSEYDILQRLIDSGFIKLCSNLQIQFHKFVENADNKRDKLRSQLSLTHHLTYDYPWIWENWELK